MAAANNLCNIHIVYVIAGSAMPAAPPVLDNVNNNNLYVLFYPSTKNYVSIRCRPSTLRPTENIYATKQQQGDLSLQRLLYAVTASVGKSCGVYIFGCTKQYYTTRMYALG